MPIITIGGCGSCKSKTMGLGCMGCPKAKGMSHGLGDGFDPSSIDPGSLNISVGDGTNVGYQGGYAPPYAAPDFFNTNPFKINAPSSSGGSWTNNLMNLLGFGVKNIAAPILNSQFGGPKPGQFFSTSPSGATTAYALPQGASSGVFGSGFGGGSNIPWGTLALIGIPLILIMSIGKK